MSGVTWQHRVEGFLRLNIKIPEENSNNDKYVLLLLLWVPSENLFIFSFTGDLGTDHDNFFQLSFCGRCARWALNWLIRTYNV